MCAMSPKPTNVQNKILKKTTFVNAIETYANVDKTLLFGPHVQ